MSSSQTSVLKVVGLRKHFQKGFIPKKVQVLEDVTFSIEPGTITGFIGGNGAGKTTTIKCLLQLVYADSGDILFFGDHPPSPEVRKRIGFMPERPYFYEYLTGYEFLRFYGELSSGLKRAELNQRIDTLLKRVNLTYAKDRPLRSYSKGMLQRVGIAQALIHRPELVIFDEPMSGLDPDGRWEVTEIIRETAGQGTAIFFSSHLLNDAEKICDRLVILGRGRVKYEGPVDQLMNTTSAGIVLQYRKGDQVCTDELKRPAELQARIDELRHDRAEIIEIRPRRMTLEEVFHQMEQEARAK